MRSAFGPRKEDGREVRNPKLELGQAVVNPLFDIAAGLAMVSPFAVATVDGGEFTYLAIMDGAAYGLTVETTSALVTTLTYQRGGYADENGNVVTYSDATTTPSLSDALHNVISADVQLLGDSVAVGNTISALVDQATDTIIVTQAGVAASVPFSILLWGRNGDEGGP